MKFIQPIIILFVLATCIATNAYCQAYNFPIKPGSKEWEKLQTHDEMLQVCQIPDSVLMEMSTNDLMESCLKYPLLLDFLAYNNIKSGFETVCNGFNGFIELKKRNDAGKYLVEKYREMNAEEVRNDSIPSYKGHDTFCFSSLELILADDKILSNLDASDKTLLMEDAMKRYEIVMKHQEIYGTFGQMTNVFLTTRVLNTMGNKDWDLYAMNNAEVNFFTENMVISTPETIDSIVVNINKITK
jgi:hypothetical protein